MDEREVREARLDSVLEGLEGRSSGLDESRSLHQARDEIERRLLLPLPAKTEARAEDGPAGLGNIVGIGIGEKLVGGRPGHRLAIKVFVREKRQTRRVAAEARVPPRLGGIRTDVQAAGDVRAHRLPVRFRRAPGGASIGHCDVAAGGTLACLVQRGDVTYILSTNHVLALVNRGPVSVGIPQPARIDGGTCSRRPEDGTVDEIAWLTQWVPISFQEANEVDAAIARTDPPLVDPRVLGAGESRYRLVPPETAPATDLAVQKRGRSTGYSRGVVVDVAVTVDVAYPRLAPTARFVNQFTVRGTGDCLFSDEGDSGALVTTRPSDHPVGLLVAGARGADLSFCSDIRKVTRSLDVAIVY